MAHMAILHTIGDGYWSDAAKSVKITKLVVPYINEEDFFGELRIHFDRKSWNVDKLGLIYTDTLFEFELKEWLKSLGYDSSDVGYSEQGMQEVDYVSCDAGKKFMTSWVAKNKVEIII